MGQKSLNDQFLSISVENWLRDVLNFIFSFDLENSNIKTKTSNFPCIDLIDENIKIAYQITSSVTPKKVESTLEKLDVCEYENYTFRMFFCSFEKVDRLSSKIQAKIEKLRDENNIRFEQVDFRDLLKSIENLDTQKLLDIYKKYFKKELLEYSDV